MMIAPGAQPMFVLTAARAHRGGVRGVQREGLADVQVAFCGERLERPRPSRPGAAARLALCDVALRSAVSASMSGEEPLGGSDHPARGGLPSVRATPHGRAPTDPHAGELFELALSCGLETAWSSSRLELPAGRRPIRRWRRCVSRAGVLEALEEVAVGPLDGDGCRTRRSHRWPRSRQPAIDRSAAP